MSNGRKLMMLGPPGAGKGTQAKKFSASLKLPHISTGDMLRAAKAAGTELGLKAKAYMDDGGLVPDELVIGIVKEALSSPKMDAGFILDGFPRTLTQAKALQDFGVALDHVINISVKDEVLVDRLSGRRACLNCGATYHVEYSPTKVEGVCDVCGSETVQREDDKPASIQNRLDEYKELTQPLIAFYQEIGNLREIDGEKSPGEVKAQIEKVLGV